MDLCDSRKKIDAVDVDIAGLLASRFACVEQVAEYKRSSGVPVLNRERERNVIDAARETAGKYGTEVAAVFDCIMGESRLFQYGLLGREIVSELPLKCGVPALENGGVFSSNWDFMDKFPRLEAVNSMEMLFQMVKNGDLNAGVLSREEAGQLKTCALLRHFGLCLTYLNVPACCAVVTTDLYVPDESGSVLVYMNCRAGQLPWILRGVEKFGSRVLEMKMKEAGAEVMLVMQLSGRLDSPDTLNILYWMKAETSGFRVLGLC